MCVCIGGTNTADIMCDCQEPAVDDGTDSVRTEIRQIHAGRSELEHASAAAATTDQPAPGAPFAPSVNSDRRTSSIDQGDTTEDDELNNIGASSHTCPFLPPR